MRASWLLAVCAAAVTGFLPGCSSEPKRLKVSGTVKYKGTPLASGSITFTPDGAGGSMGGATIKDGTFEMPAVSGLLAGKYKVSVSQPDPKGAAKEGDAPGASRDAKELIPEQYNTKTELTAEVKSIGPNEFTFELK